MTRMLDDPPDSEEVTHDTIAYLEALGIQRRPCTCEVESLDSLPHNHFECGCSVYPGLSVACRRHERALCKWAIPPVYVADSVAAVPAESQRRA